MRARKRPYLPRIDRSLELFARLSRHLEFYFCYASFLVSSIGVGDLCLLYLWSIVFCPLVPPSWISLVDPTSAMYASAIYVSYIYGGSPTSDTEKKPQKNRARRIYNSATTDIYLSGLLARCQNH